MPNITRFFNQRIIIKRLNAVSGNRRIFTSTGTFDAHIQRLDEHTDPSATNVWGATHKCWCDIAEDVDDGDDVLDAHGDRYSVVAVIQKEPGIAANEHQEVILRKYSS